MKTNNENRRRDYNSDASRDGKQFEKKNFKGTRGGARFEKSSDRPRSNDDYRRNDNRRFEKRDNQRDFSNSERKPWQNRDEKSFDKPRFDRNDERSERSGYSKPGYKKNFEGSERPRRYNSDRNERGTGRLSFKKAGDVSERYIETRFDNKKDGVSFRKRRTDDYDPNAKYSKKKQFEHKQSFVDPTKPVRLNKYLANAGICSRREADEYIQAGIISVNGEVVTELGTKVLPTDNVMFHNQPVRIERKVYILLNKPKDCVTTSEDTHARTTVLDLVKNACSERIYPVGRLDRNTTGVLLLTNDGDLASKLTHPKYEKKKIYHVGLDRDLEQEDYDKILSGIDLGDFSVKADALDFVKDDSLREVGIEIHSGQNRVVRRIFEALGYKITKLDRVYFAGLTKKNVPRGKYRFLSEKEIGILKMGAHE
ncbi:MAG TPA: pseudouridine synthase [Bacteroidales bacterium]|nr:pseudouridine synthase [Bacteroidales bacterium]